jgi:NAD(P)-dependent dehydrogenase (short-subunit alcohol dehydrogenase family)
MTSIGFKPTSQGRKERSTSWLLTPVSSSTRSSEKSQRASLTKRFGINARGLLFTVQKALPLIRDGGSIILISSIAAFKGLPAHGTYSASKAGVRSFVRTWTAELKDRGIRVNAISPGAIDTPIIDSQAATKEGADAILRRRSDSNASCVVAAPVPTAHSQRAEPPPTGLGRGTSLCFSHPSALPRAWPFLREWLRCSPEFRAT